MIMRLFAIAVSMLALASGCGDDDGATSDVRAGGTGVTRYTTTATVLESPDHGPQLCLGGVADSYPPQCGGPGVSGWDWDAVEGEESAAGTTWGTYTVVGTWDGTTLTLTEPATLPKAADARDDEQDRFETPCPEPESGWTLVDESLTSEESMQSAIAYARSQPTVGGVWIDQSINPALEHERIEESQANDPTRLILNLSFTDDLERHENAVREVWGGALCVSEASISAAELEDIRAEVEAEVGEFLTSGIDEVNGRVEIGVPVDGGLQQRFDERYGPGIVEVEPRLRPVDG